MTVFGTIISADQVEAAFTETLKTWMPTYLHEVERQAGLDPDSLPGIRSWNNHNEFIKWPEDQLPAVIVVSPGTGSQPVRRDGGYATTFTLGLAIVVSARDLPSTRTLMKRYIAAARTAILQHPSLGGFARGTVWTAESYDDIPSGDSRTLAAGQAVFEVEVANVTDPGGGPISPEPPDPPSDWPTALSVSVTVEKEEA